MRDAVARSDEEAGRDEFGEQFLTHAGSQRDVDLAGRNLVALGEAAAAAGDAGAAEAALSGALGSSDPAVAGEAAAALGVAEATRISPQQVEI